MAKPYIDRTMSPLYAMAARELEQASKPKPLPNGRPPVKPFDPVMLPDELAGFVVDTADRQQSPVDFVAVTAVCALSGLIGTRARIQPKQRDSGWLITPNLWGALIGRTSAMKSPAMRAALIPLELMERSAAKGYAEALSQYRIDTELMKIAAKTAAADAAKAIKRGSSDDARALLESVASAEPEEPAARRFIVNDASVEALGAILNQNPIGITLVRDELAGWLAFHQTEAGAPSRAFYLEAYNGTGSFTYDRIGRGHVRIESACVAMIGGIQPSKLAPVIKGALSGSSDDGLMQRLQLAVWPDDLREWAWRDQPGCIQSERRYTDVFEALDEFPVPADPDDALTLKFSDEAQAEFVQWMEALQTEARAGDLSPTMEAHLLKMPQTVARLALIFELITGGRDHVRIDATLQALAWSDYLRSHAERIYSLGENATTDAARLILERRDKLHDGFRARDLRRKQWAGLNTPEAVNEALDMLVEYQWLEQSIEPSMDEIGGRPTVSYSWSTEA